MDSNYNMFQKDAAYQRALNGRPIGQSLLEETFEAYHKIPGDIRQYITTEEYQEYARPFSAIWNFVRSAVGMTVEEAFSWQPDEEELYALRENALEEDWEKAGLSQAEKQYWKEKEGALEIPVTFFYKEGYWTLLNGCSTVSIMVLLSVAIGLSNMFPEEHVRKTDQLILSSLHGRRLYWAKLTAGAVFGVGMALLHFLFALCFSLLL